jgi:hypothetical protein
MMELEEMKNAWTDMSVQVEKQRKLTDKLILDMARQRYERGLNKIKVPELAGTVVSMAFVLLILANLDRFGTGYLLICALLSLITLLVMPFLSLSTLYRMNTLPLSDLSYKDLLIWYAAGKRRFFAVQKASIYMGLMLLITFPPVSLKIIGGKVSELEFSTWIQFSLFGLLFFALFARWVYRYYAKSMSNVENLLRDLADNS